VPHNLKVPLQVFYVLCEIINGDASPGGENSFNIWRDVKMSNSNTKAEAYKPTDVRTLVKISILGAFAFLIMLIEFPIPFFAGFLQMDFSDVPALIGGFAMGPWAGVAIELVKNILHAMFKNETALIGETANFITGSLLVLGACTIYSSRKNLKTAITGLVIGTLLMATVMSIVNYYVIIPLYVKVLHFPMDAIIGMGSAVNSSIVDLKTLVALSVLPFNLFKGIVVSLVTLLLYKRLSPILHR
jgi:riboflavin transporter FmnP